MSAQSELREALDAGDAARVATIYDRLFPDMPKAAGQTAETVMHMARTVAEAVRLEKRLYSHAWLSERGLRSGLPDELRPPPQQVRPVIVAAVGVAVNSLSRRADRQEEAKVIERLMARAAGDMHRDGITDGKLVAARMWEVRELYLAGKIRREV